MNSNFENPPYYSSSSSSSDDDDNMQMINSLEEEEEAICRANNNLIIKYLPNQQNNEVIHGSSVPGRSFINCDWESADCRLFNGYFSKTPLYNNVMFRWRYQMSRSLLMQLKVMQLLYTTEGSIRKTWIVTHPESNSCVPDAGLWSTSRCHRRVRQDRRVNDNWKHKEILPSNSGDIFWAILKTTNS